MLHVALMQPEIPQNTGNIARTCACVGATLHLVRPFGFQLTERNIRRSGMDYFEQVSLVKWSGTDEFLAALETTGFFLFTGHARRSYHEVDYAAALARSRRGGQSDQKGVFLVFGRESTGIDAEVLERYPDRCVRIPMLPERRSLNLSNAVAIALYEASRQLGFPGMA